MNIKLVTLLILTSSFLLDAYGGSATWNLSPPTNDWFDSANWTPATVPNGPSDTATFDQSNSTAISISVAKATLGEIDYNSVASAFTITMTGDSHLTLSGNGIVNNSGVTQTFLAQRVAFGIGDFNTLAFNNSATAGTLTELIADGGLSGEFGGEIYFYDNSTAGSSLIINEGGDGGDHGATYFYDSSSAAEATITNKVNGGTLFFWDTSNADHATILNEGSSVTEPGSGTTIFAASSDSANSMITTNGSVASTGSNGYLLFYDNSSAGNATLMTNGGSNGGSGGSLQFRTETTGGTARVEIFGNAIMDISLHNSPGITIGSLEGDGLVSLGSNSLTVGSNNFDTTFAGVISGAGSLKKIGRGQLTLTGANTYTGLTQVKRGELILYDRSSDFTNIAGNVAVDGGIFGGAGIVAGAVVVGDVHGRLAILESNQLHGGNLIISRSLKLNPGSTCRIDVNSSPHALGIYSTVRAHGVTISEGTLFEIIDFGQGTFPPSNFIMIDNFGTSAPIAGRFANLPEGGTIVVGHNTYVATYHGGDENDLLLMVNQ